MNAVAGHAGVVKSEITMLLALLKETSVLVSKVPCISPIAGLLLYLIQVYDVRVLSLIIKSFKLLTVCLDRIFESAKGSGRKLRGRSLTSQVLLSA